MCCYVYSSMGVSWHCHLRVTWRLSRLNDDFNRNMYHNRYEGTASNKFGDVWKTTWLLWSVDKFCGTMCDFVESWVYLELYDDFRSVWKLLYWRFLISLSVLGWLEDIYFQILLCNCCKDKDLQVEIWKISCHAFTVFTRQSVDKSRPSFRMTL